MIKEFTIILFSSFKFAMTFPLAILEYDMGIVSTIIWTNTGGLAGIFIFSFLSEQLINLWNNRIRNFFTGLFRKNKTEKPDKKVFTNRNRRIIYIKNRYGLTGIALVTPLLLSIPVGAFLVERYFKNKKLRHTYLAVSNLIWSFIYAIFYGFCYDLYLEFIG